MRLIQFLLLLGLCIISGIAACRAAAITNLAETPQTVAVGPQALVIQPGRTISIPGDVTFRYHGRDVRIDEDEEYAIWKDGQLGPQVRFRHHGFPF